MDLAFHNAKKVIFRRTVSVYCFEHGDVVMGRSEHLLEISYSSHGWFENSIASSTLWPKSVF
jgi:hypothetical protein